jgi:hypothetical protein
VYHVHSSGAPQSIARSLRHESKGVLQSTLLLGDSNGLSKLSGRGRSEIKGHKDLENHLDRYSGLVLYMKEMDEVTYGKLCAVRVL